MSDKTRRRQSPQKGSGHPLEELKTTEKKVPLRGLTGAQGQFID